MSAVRHVQVVLEGDGWSVFIPGRPVAADGRTFYEAIEEMLQALREYVQDWQDRLFDAESPGQPGPRTDGQPQ
jgi:predicted RNase H-like HicB family nuclease